MTIPNGYARLSWVLGGTALPQGARVTMGLDLTLYADPASNFLPVLKDVLSDHFAAICVFNTRLEQLELKVGPDSTGPTYVEPVNRPGSSSGNATPPNIAMLVRMASEGVSGRLFGRQYWPGWDASNLETGGTVADVAAYQLVFDELQTNLASFQVYPVVLTSLPEGPRAVTAFQVQARAATQRRRLRR